MHTAVPDWLRPHVRGEYSFNFDGTMHTYALVDRTMGPTELMPVFVIKTDGILAVSDSCPYEYREFVMIGVLLEVEHAHDANPVVAALRHEISVVLDKTDLIRYLIFRHRMMCEAYIFLKHYATGTVREQSVEELPKLKRGIEFLEGILNIKRAA